MHVVPHSFWTTWVWPYPECWVLGQAGASADTEIRVARTNDEDDSSDEDNDNSQHATAPVRSLLPLATCLVRVGRSKACFLKVSCASGLLFVH